MGSIKTFEDIQAWQEARKLVTEIYRICDKEPFSKDYDLKSQIRRAAISSLSNIAEGFERQSNKGFIQFLYIAKGSTGEVKAQLYIALDLKYITEQEFKTLQILCENVSKLIGGFIKYLKKFETFSNSLTDS